MLNGLIIMVSYGHWNFNCENHDQGEYDGRGQQTASPMFTAIMSGGLVAESMTTRIINSLEQANHV